MSLKNVDSYDANYYAANHQYENVALKALNDQKTGVLFFDDGEFDVRTNRLFAGKVRLIKG